MRVSLSPCTNNGSSRLQAGLHAIRPPDVSPSALERALVDDGATGVESRTRGRSPSEQARVLAGTLFRLSRQAFRSIALRHATGEPIAFVVDACYVDWRFVRDGQEVLVRRRVGCNSGMVNSDAARQGPVATSHRAQASRRH